MEGTEPRVQRLFHGLCRETGVGSQDLAARGFVHGERTRFSASYKVADAYMKSSVIVLLSVLLFVPLSSTLAYGEFAPGGQYNPIQIQVVETQAQKNQKKASAMQSQYGYSSYSSCRSKSSACLNNTADPLNEAACLLMVERCLGTNTSSPQGQDACPANSTYYPPGNSYAPGRCQCNSGFSMSNGVCVSTAPQAIIPAKCGDGYKPIGDVCVPFTCTGGYVPKGSACVPPATPGIKPNVGVVTPSASNEVFGSIDSVTIGVASAVSPTTVTSTVRSESPRPELPNTGTSTSANPTTTASSTATNEENGSNKGSSGTTRLKTLLKWLIEILL